MTEWEDRALRAEAALEEATGRIIDLAAQVGRLQGKLDLSENYAVLDSWMQKCASLQAEITALRAKEAK